MHALLDCQLVCSSSYSFMLLVKSEFIAPRSVLSLIMSKRLLEPDQVHRILSLELSNFLFVLAEHYLYAICSIHPRAVVTLTLSFKIACRLTSSFTWHLSDFKITNLRDILIPFSFKTHEKKFQLSHINNWFAYHHYLQIGCTISCSMKH